MLRVSRRAVERYLKDQIKKPRTDVAARLEREVKKRWQPQIRANAQGRAATTGGIVIDVHARLGYAGVPMDTTDEDRIRHLTHLTVALSPQHAARLFDAQEQGANEGRLRELAAEALKEIHFQGRRPPRRLPAGSPDQRRAVPGLRAVEAVPRTACEPRCGASVGE